MSKTPTNGKSRPARARSAHPVFDSLIAEAKQTPAEELISTNTLDQERPLTDEEIAEADAWLARMEHDEDVPVGAKPSGGGTAPRRRA